MHSFSVRVMYVSVVNVPYSNMTIVPLQTPDSKNKPLPPVKFKEGDVVWAKFNRRPWWPCQVVKEPLDGTCFRIKGGFHCYRYIVLM